MKTSPVLLFVSILYFLHLTVQAQDTLLLSTLQANQYTMQLENGLLQGTGAGFLQENAAAGQFVLVGEDHGIAELPQFTAALYRQLTQIGYQYFATETGPYTAAILQELGQRPDFLSDLRDTLLKYPWSIPFFNLREEAEMIQSIIGERKTKEPIIWGLDQEFIGAPRLLFPQLSDATVSSMGAKTIQEYAARAQKGFETTMATRNPSSIFFYGATAEDFSIIRSNLGTDQAAHKILEELEGSWEIYHKMFTGQGFASNEQRAELMKRHFWQYYQQAKQQEKHPKVLFKLGANHTYRGANGLNVFDIGNFINELASQEETGSFHLYVIGKTGTQNAFTPFADPSAKQKAYDAKNYLDQIDVSALLQLSDGEDWSIFDLRPLRALLFRKKLKNLDPALEKVIWSYDAFVVIPEVHASRNLDE